MVGMVGMVAFSQIAVVDYLLSKKRVETGLVSK